MVDYNFFTGNWTDGGDHRTPYKLICWELLECYRLYCRAKIHSQNAAKKSGINLEVSRWAINESELGYAYEQQECSYRLPIEKLMLQVLTIVLNAGRGPETVEPYHRAIIASILEKHSLDEMLKTLEGEELQMFTSDLKLIGLLEQ